MIPRPFAYVRATTVSHAIGLLRDNGEGTRLLAGGHTLIPMLKRRLDTASLLVDISGISELQGVEIAAVVRIGALCTHAQVLQSNSLYDLYPVFRQAASFIGDPQVRNRGTIGGSLANADPGADWPAIVIALNADLEIIGPSGNRWVPAANFYQGIGAAALASDEILATIRLPLPNPVMRAGYRKIAHPANGSAVVGVAAMVDMDGETISRAHIGVTGAGQYPLQATNAGAYLTGRAPSPDVFTHAAALTAAQPDYLEDGYASAAYRRHLVTTETKRLLSELLTS